MLCDSENIIVICYLSGLRGQAIDHVINFSPEMVGKPRRMLAARDGSLHDHPGPLGMLPNGQPLRLYWEAKDQDMETLLSKARTSDGKPLGDALREGKISGTSLLPPGEIRRLLPNAKIIGLSWKSAWYRAARDAAQKLWTVDTATNNNIGKYLRWQSQKMGIESGDWVSIHTRLCEDTTIGRKQYMKLEVAELFEFQLNIGDDADHVCDLDLLFSPSTAPDEYQRLCDACGITPMGDQVLPWLADYSSKQWIRA